ncbi:MAG: LacI family DNA-binding transcriptional regulator [Marmoricola sp.]
MTDIHDVAAAAGLSTATVSRALRGLAGVSEATRQRVLDAAVALNYVPSRAAAGLASGKTRTVAVVVPHVTRWYFATVVQGAEEVFRREGYDLLLFNLGGDPEARHRVLQTHQLTKRADALLILGLQPTEAEKIWLRDHAPPVALVGASVPEWPSVRIDDAAAAATAVLHLLELGHRRIAFVGGDLDEALDFATPRARRYGYRSTLATAGIVPDPALEQVGLFTIAGGVEAGKRLLALSDPPTAVFCASDEMAIGVLRSAQLAGLRVPEDLSVVGIDDHEMAEFLDLTTVAQPVLEQGRRAARQVLDLLSAARSGTPADHNDHLELPTELVVRGSTGMRPRPAGGR